MAFKLALFVFYLIIDYVLHSSQVILKQVMLVVKVVSYSYSHCFWPLK